MGQKQSSQTQTIQTPTSTPTPLSNPSEHNNTPWYEFLLLGPPCSGKSLLISQFLRNADEHIIANVDKLVIRRSIIENVLISLSKAIEKMDHHAINRNNKGAVEWITKFHSDFTSVTELVTNKFTTHPNKDGLVRPRTPEHVTLLRDNPLYKVVYYTNALLNDPAVQGVLFNHLALQAPSPTLEMFNVQCIEDLCYNNELSDDSLLQQYKQTLSNTRTDFYPINPLKPDVRYSFFEARSLNIRIPPQRSYHTITPEQYEKWSQIGNEGLTPKQQQFHKEILSSGNYIQTPNNIVPCAYDTGLSFYVVLIPLGDFGNRSWLTDSRQQDDFGGPIPHDISTFRQAIHILKLCLAHNSGEYTPVFAIFTKIDEFEKNIQTMSFRKFVPEYPAERAETANEIMSWIKETTVPPFDHYIQWLECYSLLSISHSAKLLFELGEYCKFLASTKPNLEWDNLPRGDFCINRWMSQGKKTERSNWANTLKQLPCSTDLVDPPPKKKNDY